jgi:hypothetical protein
VSSGKARFLRGKVAWPRRVLARVVLDTFRPWVYNSGYSAAEFDGRCCTVCLEIHSPFFGQGRFRPAIGFLNRGFQRGFQMDKVLSGVDGGQCVNIEGNERPDVALRDTLDMMDKVDFGTFGNPGGFDRPNVLSKFTYEDLAGYQTNSDDYR